VHDIVLHEAEVGPRPSGEPLSGVFELGVGQIDTDDLALGALGHPFGEGPSAGSQFQDAPGPRAADRFKVPAMRPLEGSVEGCWIIPLLKNG
jgi:hypothetical protein